MRAQAEEVRAVAESLRHRVERWASELQTWAHAGANGAAPLAVAEEVRTWVGASKTSSGALMAKVGAIRAANEKTVRAVRASAELVGRAEESAADCASSAREVARLFGQYEASVAQHIADDQRLIVVDSGGAQVALLVDRVREVVSVPSHLIERATGSAAGGMRDNISGIAKLDGGKRLVLRLDAQGLLREEELDAHLRKGEASSGASTSDHPQAGTGSQRVSAEHQDERLFVTFRLGDGDYGIPVEHVQEIDRTSKLTVIPWSASYVDGLINLRGEVIPVVNARKRFGLPGKANDEQTRVIIVDVGGGRKAGLLVDSVREVIRQPRADIAPPVTTADSIDQQYVQGIGKVRGGSRMILFLDVARVFAS
jgi:chemotaxis signal transduction protein